MVISCRLETFHYLPPSGKAQEFYRFPIDLQRLC